MEYQRRKLDRNERLLKKKVISFSAVDESRTEKRISDFDLQEAKVNLRLAKLEMKRALEVLKRRTIRSPVNGVVVDRFLSPGEYVSEQAPILKLARIDLLKIEAFMQIAHYGRVKVGMQAEILPQKPIGGRHLAKVTVVDKVLDAASGTFRVRLSLSNKDLLLPAGIRCQLRFLGE
jgi:membrane fusion protein (multidrug efflux system)